MSYFLRRAGIAALALGISTSFALAGGYDWTSSGVYNPSKKHGGDPLHFSYGWNHKICKKFGYHDIKGGNRYVVENDDGSWIYADHDPRDQSHGGLLKEACSKGKAGYDVWMNDPHAGYWTKLLVTEFVVNSVEPDMPVR